VITLTRRQIVLLAAPLLIVLALAGSRLARTGAAQGPARAEPLVATKGGSASTAAESPRLYVHVVGAVRRAGLYRVREGSRVADALRRAGGVTAGADLALVNLAAPLADGVQVVVPVRQPAAGPGASGGSEPRAVRGTVSLAVATVEELDGLPGIGPVTAQKIVDWRQAHGPFSSVDDLDQVPGIGPARIEQLRDLVTP
jgi:competence protein ComEA